MRALWSSSGGITEGAFSCSEPCHLQCLEGEIEVCLFMAAVKNLAEQNDDLQESCICLFQREKLIPE